MLNLNKLTKDLSFENVDEVIGGCGKKKKGKKRKKHGSGSGSSSSSSSSSSCSSSSSGSGCDDIIPGTGNGLSGD